MKFLISDYWITLFIFNNAFLSKKTTFTNTHTQSFSNSVFSALKGVSQLIYLVGISKVWATEKLVSPTKMQWDTVNTDS